MGVLGNMCKIIGNWETNSLLSVLIFGWLVTPDNWRMLCVYRVLVQINKMWQHA